MTLNSRLRWLFALILLVVFRTSGFTQDWSKSKIADLPKKMSNNAVCGYLSSSGFAVYSFAGIDSSKIYSGISLNSFKYTEDTDSWISVPPLPGGLDRIAAAASLVKGKIYIIGGYHVAQNGNETSLSHVHIFDPAMDQYLPDGSNTLIPIDDHVQLVWRDSLIYVITGWSNTNNVSAVQVYNPSGDSWALANNLPGANYRVFGASGEIVNDTIFYIGGAGNWNGSTFPLIGEVRIGVINPADPYNISWQSISDSNAAIYRSASFNYNNKAYWIGGGLNSYNYDGIAYDGSGLVKASSKIRYFDASAQRIEFSETEIEALMDLRGVGVKSESQDEFSVYTAGGMDSAADVTSHCFKYSISLVGLDEIHTSSNPGIKVSYLLSGIKVEWSRGELQIFDSLGRKVTSFVFRDEGVILSQAQFKPGVYFVSSSGKENSTACERVLIY